MNITLKDDFPHTKIIDLCAGDVFRLDMNLELVLKFQNIYMMLDIPSGDINISRVFDLYDSQIRHLVNETHVYLCNLDLKLID